MAKRPPLRPDSAFWILDDDDIEIPVGLETWARWFEDNDKRRKVFNSTHAGARVSTVFIGHDLAWGAEAPLLYETMVFGGPLDGHSERYATRPEAINGHAVMLARVIGAARNEQ